MTESVAVAKEADAKKGVPPTRSDNSIHRVRNEPERQLGSLRDVIGNIRRDGGTPSAESIAAELSGVHATQRAPALLALQHTHGNRYVQRVVAGIQAKLVVGQPGDIYEQEADRVADAVMRMPEPGVQRQTEEEEEELQAKPLAEQIAPLVQKQPIEKKEEELQAKEIPGQTSEVTPNLESRINAIRGGGQPLPASARAFFEPRFGYNFSQVGVQTDSAADTLSRALNVRAFTVGRDIVFEAGQYKTETAEGKQLIAHELTHIIQQEGGFSKNRGNTKTLGVSKSPISVQRRLIMRTFAHKPKATQQTKTAESTKAGGALSGQNRDEHSILHLQQTIGNQAVLRLLRSNTEDLKASPVNNASTGFVHDFSRIPVHDSARSNIQPKLKVNVPGDQYEQEADRVAEQVMGMPEKVTATTSRSPDRLLSAAPSTPLGSTISLVMQTKLLSDQIRPLVQRQVEPEKEKEEGTVQSKPLAEQITPLVQRQVESEQEELIQTTSERTKALQLNSNLASPIQSLRGRGRPLSKAERGYFEPRFGKDLGGVRIHTDTRSGSVSNAIHARAFTVGKDIVFAPGQYNTQSHEGKRLLAHELTHVVQQMDPQISGLRKMSTTGSTQPELQVSSLPNARIQRTLQYDTYAYRLRELTIPESDDMRLQLAEQIRVRLRSNYPQVTISQTRTDLTEEMRVMDGLIQYLGYQSGGRTIDHTDTESDLLIPDPGQEPIRVTVQTDSAGVVTATVHANRPLTQLTSPFTDRQAAITAIQSDFAMTVSDTLVYWTLEQLNQVILALRQLSTGERNQLSGIQLVRDSDPPIGSHPRTMGDFAANLETTSGRRDRPATITLYDRAFESNERLFFGSSQTAFPASFGATMHEIGHAIEQQPRASALVLQNIAADEQTEANRLYRQSVPARENAMEAMNTAIEGLDTARRGNRSRVTAQQTQAHRQFLARIRALITILRRINNNSDSQNLTVLTQDLERLPDAVQQRDQAAATLRLPSTGYPFMQEAEQLIQAQDTYIEASRTSAGLFQAYRRLRSTLQERERETAALSEGNRSLRLASFETMLRAPPQEAPTSYDISIEEIFAESFMLYRSDPEFLRTHRPHIFAWFVQGHHLQ